MDERLMRNIGAITPEEQAKLHTKTAFIAGCGGLGGFVAEMLSRIGIGKLVLCDFDIFTDSNYNRQVFCIGRTMGKNKAEAIAELFREDRRCEVEAHAVRINAFNGPSLIEGCDVVIDALDNMRARYDLQFACKKAGIPMVTGGVSHWHGHVSTIFPGEDSLRKIFGRSKQEHKPSVVCFAAGVIGCNQAAEAVKVLLGRPGLHGRLLIVDLLGMMARVLPLNTQNKDRNGFRASREYQRRKRRRKRRDQQNSEIQAPVTAQTDTGKPDKPDIDDTAPDDGVMPGKDVGNENDRAGN